MADQYGHQLPDLGRLATGRTHFPVNQETPQPYFFNRSINNETVMLAAGEMVLPAAGGLVRFGHHHDFAAAATNHPTAVVDMESSGWGNTNESGNGRWPRQETLTLLEIRSRLDSKFKEANHKKPLWDEVSRIMAEEHGYHRSEKKCREKFENLYKYYKKTKEGKAGRQDGKHYRFFRQLEALYGETSNNQNSVSELSPLDQNTTNFLHQTPNQENQENQEASNHLEQKLSDQSLSFSNTSEFETASSGNNNDEDLSAIAFMMNQKSMEKHNKMNESRSGKRDKRSSNWKGKVKEFVDAQMRELMESQEAWMERMLKTIEDREKERLCKEEAWRKQEMARFDKVHEFWARERAWVEGRDNALMEALKKVTGRREPEVVSSSSLIMHDCRWNEPETLNLMQLITSLEPKFEQSGYSNESIWEEIAAKMASFGYYRSAIEFKEKWENMQMYYHHHGHDQIAKQKLERMELFLPSNNPYAGTQGHQSCFHIQQINEGQQQFWEKGKTKRN